jgi:hypothetical protein
MQRHDDPGDEQENILELLRWEVEELEDLKCDGREGEDDKANGPCQRRGPFCW